ncbi:MAG: hypothetical protein N3A58_03630 [Spirochaetes bacterium]|nr:hypothetical protein [Spirochaetota bacterium]
MNKQTIAVIYIEKEDKYVLDIYEYGDDIIDFENFEISETPNIDLSPYIKREKLETIYEKIPKANFNEIIEDDDKKYKFEQFVKKVFDVVDEVYFFDHESNSFEKIDYDDFLDIVEKYDEKVCLAIYQLKEIDEDSYIEDEDEYLDEDEDYDYEDEEDEYEDEFEDEYYDDEDFDDEFTDDDEDY